MTTEGRREGFVGVVQWLWTKGGSQKVVHVPTEIVGRPVYVQPLVEGEPVPGETWRFRAITGTEDVTIVTPAYDDDDCRRVVVRCSDGGTTEVCLRSLTRAPETREVEIIIHDGTRLDRQWFAIRKDTPASDLMAAIRGAVEVDNDA